MRVDLARTGNISSSFLSVEKDTETILRRLFVENRPYSDVLKSLMTINTPDCLSNLDKYKERIESIKIKDLRDKKQILTTPKIPFGEHENVKSYILFAFDNFTPNEQNPEFRDCTISISVVCHLDSWDLDDYQQRPIKIMGYIDALLNKSKLSGIGTLNFLGANELLINSDISGYNLAYRAIHGSDDKLPAEDC